MSWATFWTAIGTEFFKQGMSGLAGGKEQGGGYQYTSPSFEKHKIDLEDTASEAGEAGEIKTADVIKITEWQARIFNPPYQKTEIVIPPIMRV